MAAACAAPPPSVPTTAPTAAPPASSAPAATVTAVPAATRAPSPTTRPAATAAPTPSPSQAPGPIAATLPIVDSTATVRGAGFLTPVELDLELQQALSDAAALRQLVEYVQRLDCVAAVRSDGVRIQVRYDSTHVLPARIRARLAELGHPARGGTDVQNPGDAAD